MAKDCECGCGRRLRFAKARASAEAMRVAIRHDEFVDAQSVALPPERTICLATRDEAQKLADAWFEVAHGERRRSPNLSQVTDKFMHGSALILDGIYIGRERPTRKDIQR